MSDPTTTAKQTLVTAGRILSAQGQGEWTRGHLSIRCPDDPGRFFIKPKDAGLEEITPESIVTCDLDGNKVAGAGALHGEVHIHSGVYRARPDLKAVIHAHPLHAVVFSALGRPLQAIGLPGAAFCDGLPVFSETNFLIRTPELGAAMARVLGPHKALLLQNHGVVVAGESMEEAIYLAMALEAACQMQVMAEAAGGAKALGTREDVEALRRHMLRETMFRRTFAYLARKAGAGTA